MLDLSLLLCADNATRNAAEQALDQAQEAQPHLLAQHLTDTLANAAEPPTSRTMAAVLLRRRLPAMLGGATAEWRTAIKAKLLACLAAPCDAPLRRKVCDAVGRLGVETHADGSWPELMQWVLGACAAGEPVAHEAALAVLGHMAPALVQPASWSKIGAQLLATLLAALGDGGANVPPPVAAAALSALASLVEMCGVEEKGGAVTDTEEKKTAAYRKQQKAVANDLAAALPPMLRALEVAVGAADGERIGEVLGHLATAAASLPRLFKPVLGVVVDGMAQLATLGAVPCLDADGRISCVELLLTLAEGAPKLCAKHGAYVGKVVGALLPMLVRLEGELSEWEAAAPSDGLHGDDDDDDEKEAGYAAEALERLCEALGGDAVTQTLLPELQAMLAPASAWNMRHGGLVALAFVCEHGASVIEPHLPSLVEVLAQAAAAPESRLRWAACYCLAMLCSEFSSLVEAHHAALCPLLIRLAGGDPSRRVVAAACLATVNVFESMAEAELLAHAQPTLAALHPVLAGGSGAPDYVCYAAASSLAVLAAGLEDADGAPMASAYGAFIPHLAQRLGPAVDQRNGRLASHLLSAIGNVAAASGEACVAADAAGLIASVAGLLQRPEVTDDRDLLRTTHTCLTHLAGVARAPFLGVFEQLLPALLAAAATEVDFQMDKVEVPSEEEEEDGWDCTYVQNHGRGFLRIRVNAAQMDGKLLALDALYSYAVALGAAFHPAAAPLVEACVPLLSYQWSDKVRGQAATCLAGAYKCLVLAKADASVGAVGPSHVADALGAILKPVSDQLNKEKSIEAADALLDCVLDVVRLERTHAAGALPAQQAVGGVSQLIKIQLQKGDARARARAEAAAERDEDEEASEEEEAEVEAEEELLATCANLIGELLRQHGGAAGAVGVVEAQLLPHIQPWLAGDEVTKLALGLEIVAQLVAAAEREHAKKYVSAALPLLGAHADSDEPRLRRAALYGLGVVAEHGGKLLTRAAAADLGKKLVAVLSAPEARLSANGDATDAAVAALGKVFLHRPQALDAEGALPLWLGFLPLRHAEEDAASAVESLCKMLEADAPAVFGADGGRFPVVLGAIAAVYETEALGGTPDASGRLRALVHAWKAQHGAQFDATVASGVEKAHLREKIAKIAAA